MRTRSEKRTIVGWLAAAAVAWSAGHAGGTQATGGWVTNYFQNGIYYTAHIFTTVGTTNLTVTEAGEVEVLVVAGGGGGGAAYGGGGGAGGLIYTSGFPVAEGSLSVIVGAGGSGGTNIPRGTANFGANGSNSVFSTLTAFGGGGAPGYLDFNTPGKPGGSGGGGILNSTGGGIGGAATNGQGHAGGDGAPASHWGGGGGGGAGTPGGNGATDAGGQGGNGVSNNISGVWLVYAGGGGGGTHMGGSGGAGGSGGGGAGGSGVANNPGLPGTNGLGGGGGGSSYNTEAGYLAGGAGGSGVVIVRYANDKLHIQNRPVTHVSTNGATFTGWLVRTGESFAAVCVLWGETNGGQTWEWAHTNWWDAGAFGNDSYPSTNIALDPNKTYYYTFGAVNAVTNAVAAEPVSFITGQVTVEATDDLAQYRENNGQFTIRRPPTAAQEPITVEYAMSGSAVNGLDYALLSGSVTMGAGVSNVTLTVIPALDSDRRTESATLTLTADDANRYALETPPGSATVLILKAGEYDPTWTNHVRTITFYEGDAYGTVCQDIYIDASNIYQNVNFNGQGLKLKFGASGGVPERPGYIRFENVLDQLPADAFVVSAVLRLTANAPSTGEGNLKVAARGNFTFQETNAAYVAGGGNIALASRTAIAMGGRDQLWAGRYNTTLASNSLANAIVTPAFRAWLDHYRNGAHGYTNQGVAMNINPEGSGVPGGTVSFFDSETADTNNRPKLIVSYLPASSGYQAFLYQSTVTNTSQLRYVIVNDAHIWRDNQNGGVLNLFTNNYGGQVGSFAPCNLDPSSLLFRWKNLELPPKKKVVDARLRFSATDGFSSATDQTVNWEIRKVLRPWVEGTGTTAKASYVGVTYTNFNALSDDLSLNKWQTAGGIGAQDSTNLFAVNGYGVIHGEVLMADTNGLFKAVVEDWFRSDANNGLMIRGVNNSRVHIYFANLGYPHLDPYVSPGLLVVFKKDAPPGTLMLVR